MTTSIPLISVWKEAMMRATNLLLIVFVMLACPAIGLAQGGGQGGGGQGGGGGPAGGEPGGGDVGGNLTGQTGIPSIAQNQGPTQQSTFQAGTGTGITVGDLTLPTTEFVNERIQPFVGPSSATLSPHPRSQIAAGAGGGAGGGGGGAADFNRQLQNLFGNQFGNQLGVGAGNGFEIARRGVRTRMVSRIATGQTVTGAQISNRFRQRLSRIPEVASVSSSVRIEVDGITATLTGVVRSDEDKQNIERMARLEPGIYRIQNRLEVVN